jgi:cell pole-organizing protein PopZ
MNAALESLMNVGKAPPLNLDPYARPQPQADTASRYQAPYGQSNYSTNTYSTSTYASYEPDPVTAAAAAFDALAQGLAASSRPEPRRAYDYQQPAAPAPSHTALVAQPLLPVVQEYHPQAIRTLEDAVAEMLKPMLQRWLSDNMPRIIERALRFEAASGMKPPNSQ